MKLVAISDLHGDLDFSVPECDLLLIAGDICRYGRNYTLDSNWLSQKFNPWLKEQPAKKIVMTPGNHDIIFEKATHLIPELNCKVLIDQKKKISGLNIYGSPWQLAFCHWGFNVHESVIGKKWENIPNNIDILLLHGPPYKIGDVTSDYYTGQPRNVGCKKLRKKIFEVKPKLVVFGHIHDGHGIYKEEGITFINASLLDDRYEMVHKPTVFEMEV